MKNPKDVREKPVWFVFSAARKQAAASAGGKPSGSYTYAKKNSSIHSGNQKRILCGVPLSSKKQAAASACGKPSSDTSRENRSNTYLDSCNRQRIRSSIRFGEVHPIPPWSRQPPRQFLPGRARAQRACALASRSYSWAAPTTSPLCLLAWRTASPTARHNRSTNRRAATVEPMDMGSQGHKAGFESS